MRRLPPPSRVRNAPGRILKQVELRIPDRGPLSVTHGDNAADGICALARSDSRRTNGARRIYSRPRSCPPHGPARARDDPIHWCNGSPEGQRQLHGVRVRQARPPRGCAKHGQGAWTRRASQTRTSGYTNKHATRGPSSSTFATMESAGQRSTPSDRRTARDGRARDWDRIGHGKRRDMGGVDVASDKR